MPFNQQFRIWDQDQTESNFLIFISTLNKYGVLLYDQLSYANQVINEYNIYHFSTRLLDHMSKSTNYSHSAIMIFLLAMSIVVWSANACVSLHGEEREIIDAREILNSQNNIVNCLKSSLVRGKVGLAKSIVELYDSQHQKSMVDVLEEELRRLKQLQAEILLSESTCQPVAKWGQNETHLFLSLKMSHRWDSPPCLNTKDQTALSSQHHLNYTNICVVSNSKITFNFLTHFYHPVSSQPIAISKDGVGIYSAIIEKQEAKVWPYLGKDEKSYPIWAEISERHNSVHKEYQTLLSNILRAKRSKPVVLEQDKKETSQQPQEIENTAANSQPVQNNAENTQNTQEAQVVEETAEAVNQQDL